MPITSPPPQTLKAPFGGPVKPFGDSDTPSDASAYQPHQLRPTDGWTYRRKFSPFGAAALLKKTP